jgi:hypothetical protein
MRDTHNIPAFVLASSLLDEASGADLDRLKRARESKLEDLGSRAGEYFMLFLLQALADRRRD